MYCNGSLVLDFRKTEKNIIFVNNYGIIDRLHHRLALGPQFIRQFTFDIEQMMVASRRLNSSEREVNTVYIMGLARSGTTIVLRLLDQVPEFCSLTYRDMPWILAPNFLKKLNRILPRDIAPTERVHGDGLMVSLDSPESFEEIFWRTVLPSVKASKIYPSQIITPEILDSFAIFRQAVLASRNVKDSNEKPTHYLSKNNNNIVRINTLLSEKNASAVVVYRNPMKTAKSLFNIHNRFCVMASRDKFLLEYMGWLNHFEFGPDHKPFDFIATKMNANRSPLQADYWLDYWIEYHKHLQKIVDSNPAIKLVNHDALVADPKHSTERLLSSFGVVAQPKDISILINQNTKYDCLERVFDESLVKQAERVYNELSASNSNLCKAMPS